MILPALPIIRRMYVPTGITMSVMTTDPRYSVEIEVSPDGSSWSPFTTVPPAMVGSPIMHVLPLDGQSRFYRARQTDGTPGGRVGPWLACTPASGKPTQLGSGPLRERPLQPGLPAPRIMADGLYAVAATDVAGRAVVTDARPSGGTYEVMDYLYGIVPNADMDVWDSASVANSWINDIDVTVAKETTVVYSGNAAAKLSNPNNATNGGWHGMNTAVASIPLRPGATYRLKIATRSSRIAGGQLYRLLWYFDAALTNSLFTSFAYRAANVYQIDEWTFTVPLNAERRSQLNIQVNRNGDATATDFYLDSIRIVEQEIGSSGAFNLATSGREDLILNGDFESGLSWWGDLGANVAAIETGANKYLGNKSLKITHTAAANERVYLVDDVGDTTLGTPLTMRVQPGDRLRVRMAGKVSGASMAIGLGIKLLKQDFTLDTDFNPGGLQFTTTSFVEKEIVVNLVGISSIYYVQIYVYMTGAASGTGYADEVHLWRMKQTEDIVDRKITGVKIAGEAVNAQEIGKDIPFLIGQHAPNDLVFNGDFEYTTFFGGADSGTPSGFWGSSAGGGLVPAGAAYKGSNSGSFVDNGAAALDWFQTWHTTGGGTEKLLIRVRPGSTIVFHGAGKLSAATQHLLRFGFEAFDDTKASLGKTTALSWSTETAFTEKWAAAVLGATTYYICLWVGTDLTAGTPAGQLLDDLHAFIYPPNPSAGDKDEGDKAANWTMDLSAGPPNRRVRLTASHTISFSNFVKGAIYIVRLVQDGTGSRVPTLNGVTWAGGAAPTWTTTANRQDLVTLYSPDGSALFGVGFAMNVASTV